MSPLAPVDHHLTPIGVEVSWPLELSIGFRQGSGVASPCSDL